MKVVRTQIEWLMTVLLYSCCAFAGTFTAFGPQSYVRNTDQPVTISNSFSILNPNTQYTLHVENSGVSSAVISINGTQILGPNDFLPPAARPTRPGDSSITVIDKPISLQLNNQID